MLGFRICVLTALPAAQISGAQALRDDAQVRHAREAFGVGLSGEELPALRGARLRGTLFKYRPTAGAGTPKQPSCSLQRALLTLQVNPGSLYRCGKSA